MSAILFKHRLRLAPSLGILAVLAAACAGENQGQHSSVAARPAEIPAALPWPPEDLPGRRISDDSMFIRGIDYSSKGGSVVNSLSFIRLSPNPVMSWAMYTVDGLGPDCTIESISANYDIITGSTGDGTGLYWLLANYSLGHWEWVLNAPPSEDFSFAGEFANYVSPSGKLSIACIHTGPGTTQVTDLHVYRSGTGAVVPVPQNLAATATYGKVQLAWDSVTFALGYNVYRDTDSAFDDPVKVNGLAMVGQASYDDTSVDPLTPYWYAVTAVRGDTGDEQESAYSNVVDITSSDSNIPAPQNLTGSGDVGSVQLSWDAVTGAEGYIVYRDVNPAFNAPTAISSVIPDTQYTDSTGLTLDRIYYYCVTAAALPYESAFSNMVDISVPAADLPAPENLRITALSGDYVSIAWDYDHAAVGNDGYNVYFGYYPDFRHDQYYLKFNVTNPLTKDYSRFGFPPGATYYIRVCAYDNTSKNGRLSEDVSFTTEQYWSWTSPAESVASGDGPISLIKAGGEATLAFVSGSEVRVARRNAGSWSDEAIGLDDTVATSGFGGAAASVDIAYTGSEYIVGACAPAPEDAWVSIGNPGGAWAATRIDGDDNTQLGHGISGHDMRVATDGSEFSVLHRGYNTGSLQDELLLQQKPTSGGSWSMGVINANVNPFLQHSCAYRSGNLYELLMQSVTHNFYFGDQDGGWNWQDIGDSPGQNTGLGNDLQAWGSEWITPAYNGATKELFAMTGDGASWSKASVAGGLDSLNRMQICVTAPGEAVMIFFSSSNSRWFYAALKDGAWSSASLIIAGYTPGVFMDIIELGGYPFIVFDDGAGNLLASTGAPPA